MAYIPDEAALAMRKELTPAARDLFVYYCVRRNKNSGGFSCPQSRVLHELEGMDRRTYFRGKAELVEKEWITVKGDFVKPIRGFVCAKNDTLEVEKSAKNDTDKQKESDKNGTASDKNGTASDKNGTAHIRNIPATLPASITSQSIVQPEEPASPVAEDSKPEQLFRDRKKKKDASEIEIVFAYWQEITGHPNAKLDKKRSDRIKARLKTFSVDEMKLCLDGWKKSAWHQGVNPTNTVYDQVSTIFRDAEQVEKFRDLATTNPAGFVEVRIDSDQEEKALIEKLNGQSNYAN